MMQYFDKEEFMKAPVELHSVTETYDVLEPRNNIIMPFMKEQSIVLNIGDRAYDIRDLVYRLLRAEGEVVSLMEKVADLQTHVQILEDKMKARKIEPEYDTKVLDEYIRGVWKDIGN